jgi:hypothetical protein
MDCRAALQTILAQVDYTSGARRVNEMIGAVLPKEVITLARKAIADEATQPPRALDGAESWACECGWSNEIPPQVCVGCGQPRRSPSMERHLTKREPDVCN